MKCIFSSTLYFIVFFLTGMLLLFLGHYHNKNKTQTTCTVISTELKTDTCSDHYCNCQGTDQVCGLCIIKKCYKLVATVYYNANEERVTSQLDVCDETDNKDKAYDTMGSYGTGTQFECYFLKTNPTDVYLTRTNSVVFLVFAIIALVFAGFGMCVCLGAILYYTIKKIRELEKDEMEIDPYYQ